jgi:hypothetical protein
MCLSALFPTFGEPFSIESSKSSIQYATSYPIYLYFTGTAASPSLIPNENSIIG